MEIIKLNTEKHRLGRLGERAARRYLWLHGYVVRAKNYVADNNEVDIIATNREYMVFVEVKTRDVNKIHPNEPRPASSVTPEKQRSVMKAANIYAAFHPMEKKKRFDVIEVYVKEKNGRYRVAEIKHLINTFNKNTAYKNEKGRKSY